MSTPASFAANQFRQRQARARDAIAAGKMRAADAERHLRPWAAIACRVGADLDELRPGLAELRDPETCIHGTFRDPGDALARAMLADDLARRSEWAPLLAAARDRALATKPRAESTIELCMLAAHLRVPLDFNQSRSATSGSQGRPPARSGSGEAGNSREDARADARAETQKERKAA